MYDILYFQGIENEDKNDLSDTGDDSNVNIECDKDNKNSFDWASLENVIMIDQSKEDSDNEKSVESEPK